MGLQRNTGESEGRWLCSQQNRTPQSREKKCGGVGVRKRQEMGIQYSIHVSIMSELSSCFNCKLKERGWARGDKTVG